MATPMTVSSATGSDLPRGADEKSATNFRISVVAMTGTAIAIDDASAADTIHSVKERVFAADCKLPVRRQRLVNRLGPHGINPLADDETLGGAGVAQDGTAELDVLLVDWTAAEAKELAEKALIAARNGRTDDMVALLEEGVDENTSDDSGNTLLIIAAWEGHTECVRRLLEGGIDTETKIHGGDTALTCAAVRNHIDCVRLLIDHGADKEVKNLDGWTALIRAASEGHTDCVRMLVECGADMDAKDMSGNGETALSIAAREGRTECVRLLLECGADKASSDMNGMTALDHALENGHLNIIDLLTAKQVEPTEPDVATVPLAVATCESVPLGADDRLSSNFRVFVIAMTGAAIAIDDASASDTVLSVKERVFAANRQLPVRRQRLVYRPGPHGINPLADDETLGGAGVAQDGSVELDVLLTEVSAEEAAELAEKLAEAAMSGSADDVLSLLAEGADKNAKDEVRDPSYSVYAHLQAAFCDGNTALKFAAEEGHTDCVRLLLECGADIDVENKYNYTALDAAIYGGQIDCVRLLLERGANMEARTDDGYTALYLAVVQGDTDCVRLLLESGADKDARTHEGDTALIDAAKQGQIDCVRLLVEAGADKEAADEDGCTALMYASKRGSTDCVRLLVECGADKEAQDKSGMTALAHAHERFLEGSQPDESYEYLDSVTDADYRAQSYPAIVSLLTATDEQPSEPTVATLHATSATAVSSPHSDDNQISYFRIYVVAMTGAAIAIDDASAADTVLSVKERLFAANRKLPVRRQRLVYRPGPHGIEPLADDETLGGVGVARDGTAELDVLLVDLTALEADELGRRLLSAAAYGHVHGVLAALDEGAHKDAKDNVRNPIVRQGNTALKFAAQFGRTDCVRLLLECGADMEARNKCQETPLMCAARAARTECVRLLLESGVGTEAKDESGVTALGHALASGHADCVRVLIDCGADASADGIDQAQLERLLAHANVTAEDALWM